jgi:hypothetical protein
MINSGTDFGLRLMRAVGAQVGVTYLSAPISTGYRDLSLMRELGVSKQELRERFATEYRTRVIAPNEREAYKFAQIVRRLPDKGLVVNPGELFVPGWGQSDYLAFWEETIRSYCLELALSPGWEYSAGARFEAGIALQTNMRIMDIQGRDLSPEELMEMDRRARARLAREGFDRNLVESYIPRVNFLSLSADPAHLNENIQALADSHQQSSDVRRPQDDQNKT